MAKRQKKRVVRKKKQDDPLSAVDELKGEVESQLKHASKAVEHTIKKHPWFSVGIAIGIGYLLGKRK